MCIRTLSLIRISRGTELRSNLEELLNPLVASPFLRSQFSNASSDPKYNVIHHFFCKFVSFFENTEDNLMIFPVRDAIAVISDNVIMTQIHVSGT